MKVLTFHGKTVDEAIQTALNHFGVSKEQVKITTIDEGKKGLFGFFSKQATIQVELVEVEKSVQASSTQKIEKILPKQEQKTIHSMEETDAILEAKSFLKDVVKEMNIDAEVTTMNENERQVNFLLSGEKAGLLIGKHGQTLNALQYLTQLVVNRESKQYIRIGMDVENYRERRREALTQLAKRLAMKATRTGMEVRIESLPAHERKIVHEILSREKGIETYSVGSEPHRHMMITPQKKSNEGSKKRVYRRETYTRQ